MTTDLTFTVEELKVKYGECGSHELAVKLTMTDDQMGELLGHIKSKAKERIEQDNEQDRRKLRQS